MTIEDQSEKTQKISGGFKVFFWEISFDPSIFPMSYFQSP